MSKYLIIEDGNAEQADGYDASDENYEAVQDSALHIFRFEKGLFEQLEVSRDDEESEWQVLWVTV